MEEEGLTSFAIEELVPLAIRRYPEKIAAEMVKDITKIDRIRSRSLFYTDELVNSSTPCVTEIYIALQYKTFWLVTDIS